jgi:hypothetical protein
MSRRWKSISAGFAAVGLIAFSALGICYSIARLPGLFELPPDNGEGDSRVTWLGQGEPTSLGLGILLLVIIYSAKGWILRLKLGIPAAAFLVQRRYRLFTSLYLVPSCPGLGKSVRLQGQLLGL